MRREEQTTGTKTFELLAPAGSLEIFKAVIAAGADAVYVGGSQFGARAYANNFSEEEMLEALDYAHLHGRKVYLTVNTLLKNTELNRLYEYLKPFYEHGLDAVLVQDFGVLTAIHYRFPDLPIHTSTQMTVTGAESAKIFASLGVTRMVMARELSLAEMKQIHDETGMELEAFVHGALCYCYSGQCLLSSMLGGRSGNRGRCAQPCRLSYSVLDEKHKAYQKDSYVLSLKDMCGIRDLKKLKEAGVYSLKIEGRMKQIPYAAGVVSYYRNYIDRLEEGENPEVSAQDDQKLLDLGNRCGFTDGYYQKQNGSDMVTFTKPGYEKTNEKLQQQIIKRFAGGAKKIPADGIFMLQPGKPAVYEVTVDHVTVHVEGMEVMEAQKKPLVKEDVIARFEKTGDTPFVMHRMQGEIQEGSFLPNGALNQLRREALDLLQKKLLAKDFRTDQYAARTLETLLKKDSKKTRKKKQVTAVIANRSQLAPVLASSAVTRVCLDMEAYDWKNAAKQITEDTRAILQADKEPMLALPRIFRQRTSEKMKQFLPQIKELPFVGILVRNYEELAYVKEHWDSVEIVADHNLYCYNDLASRAFAAQGVAENTVPLELNRGEILHRDNTSSGMVVYGYYPLMTSAQCVHGNTKGCDHTPGITYLKDRYQVQFPMKNFCAYCYNVIYNSLPVLLFANLPELEKSGISDFRLDFTVESEKETAEVLALLEQFENRTLQKYPQHWQNRYTNGHYKRGVE